MNAAASFGPSDPIAVDDLDEVHEHITTLIGRYERAVGMVDNLLDRRFEVLGDQTLQVLRSGLLHRVQGAERLRLLGAVLLDVGSQAPADAMVTVLQEVRRLRNAAAHAAETMIEGSTELELRVAFLPLIRRSGPSRTHVAAVELAGHHTRLAWVTDWLQYIQYTDPHFETGSEWETVWRQTMSAPSRRLPPLRGSSA